MPTPVIANYLSCFEGIEEPNVRVLVGQECVVPDEYVNIREIECGVFRMTLRHYSKHWWDGDRNTANKDRQRAEVKGLGSRQNLGEEYLYTTTWRGNPDLRGAGCFCHIFQLKATKDKPGGMPLVTLSILASERRAAVQYTPADLAKLTIVREFDWLPDHWQSVKIRIKPSDDSTGEVMVSIDDDEFKGQSGLILRIPERNEYRPKWGFYRGIAHDLRSGEDYVEHRGVSSQMIIGNT